MSKQVAIWIDHQEARILHIPPDQLDDSILSAHLHEVHQRASREAGDRERPADERRFFRRVGKSLKGAKRILLLGPSTPKLDFARFLRKHEHALERRIVGIETVEQPDDRQLLKFAKEYFPTTRAS
ncbi:MAG: hypothetical protein ABI548_17825 [Polyangiaceae bacterium]